jgi:uncharacterized membrane protein
MKASARILGHGVHPILIVFPLGMLGGSVAFDVVRIVTHGGEWATVAFWMIAAGLIGGVLAAVFGLIDWLALPSHTRAKSVGLLHAAVNFSALVLFFISWLIRLDARSTGADTGMLPFLVSLAGLVLAVVGGWLGGELVERMGVSVYPNANVNAPSSLRRDNSARPAG